MLLFCCTASNRLFQRTSLEQAERAWFEIVKNQNRLNQSNIKYNENYRSPVSANTNHILLNF